MNLIYKLEQVENIPVMRIGGRFDAEGAAFIKYQIANLVSGTQPNLLINLGAVEFLDSLGLAALVGGLKKCRNNHGSLKLVGLPSSVQTLFEVTRLDRAFDIYDNDAAALSAFANNARL